MYELTRYEDPIALNYVLDIMTKLPTEQNLNPA